MLEAFALEPPVRALAVPPLDVDVAPALEVAPLVPLAVEADAVAPAVDPVAVPVLRPVDPLRDVDEVPAEAPVPDPEPEVEDRERLREVDPDPPVDEPDAARDDPELLLEVDVELVPELELELDVVLVVDDELPSPLSESELQTSGEGIPLVRFAT